MVIDKSLFIVFFFLGLSVFSLDYADAADNKPTTSSLGQYPAETPAERELEAMLRKPDKEIDLALANYLIVADLPSFKGLTREEYLSKLDQTTRQVKSLIDRARANPALAGPMVTPSRLAFVFCSGIIRLGIDYPEEFKRSSEGPVDVRPMYQDANNLFLAGLLRTGKGTCVSLPQMYLVIGHRLDLPLYLVNIGQHFFIRWEDPSWRMNIETTITKKVAMSPDEDNFLEAERMTRDQLKGTDALRNLTHREVIGHLLFTRAGWYMVQGLQFERQFVRDVDRARYLVPENQNIKTLYQKVTSAIQSKEEPSKPPLTLNQAIRVPEPPRKGRN